MAFNRNDYAKKLLDPRWQKLRLEVFQRDAFKCQSCGADHKTLNAHHSYYDRSAEGPWDYPVGSIVTLCDDCHKEEHEFFGVYRETMAIVLCGAGFSTSDRQAELCTLLNLLSDMSNAERESFLEMVRGLANSRLKSKDGQRG